MTVKLNHRFDGKGPHVLLLHAVGVDLTFLDAVAAKLARDFTVLRADLRGWLDAHGVGPQCGDAVLLACSEAVANAIEHGYRNDPFGMIDVVATVTADTVEVRVTDHGTWRDMTADAAGGRGLQLIRQSMDQVTFDRGNGTTVTMRRRREAAP